MADIEADLGVVLGCLIVSAVTVDGEWTANNYLQ